MVKYNNARVLTSFDVPTSIFLMATTRPVCSSSSVLSVRLLCQCPVTLQPCNLALGSHHLLLDRFVYTSEGPTTKKDAFIILIHVWQLHTHGATAAAATQAQHAAGCCSECKPTAFPSSNNTNSIHSLSLRTAEALSLPERREQAIDASTEYCWPICVSNQLLGQLYE